jgi:hypothetical protein
MKVYFKDEETVSQPLQFQDKLQMPTKRRFKISGQMIAPCSIARVGVMEYKAKECGTAFADRDPESIVKIMTTEQELFDAESLDSYRSSPITIGHPKEDVNTENAKELIKGVLEGLPVRDGDMLVGSLVLNDADAISLVRANHSQLSSGHTCILKMADNADCGWDAEKTKIRANHIAIVSRGRAGTAEIADEAIEEVVEEVEVPVEVDEKETAKEVIPESQEAEAEPEVKVGDAALVKSIEELTAKLEDAEGKLKEANKKLAQAKEVDIDTLVEKRMDFIKEVESIAVVETKGKSEIEIKRAVVEKVKAMSLADKSDTYIEVRYQILLEDRDSEEAATDISQVLRDSAGKTFKKDKPIPANLTAREEMIKRNQGVK